MSKEGKIFSLDEDESKIAIKEIKSGNQQADLWAKALTISGGDEREQRAVYLKLRASELKENPDFSGKGSTEPRSKDVDRESDPVLSENVQKSKHSKPESQALDASSGMENVKTQADEMKADLARWREEHKLRNTAIVEQEELQTSLQEAKQPRPQHRSQKVDKQPSPAPISSNPKKSAAVPTSTAIIIFIFVFLLIGAYVTIKLNPDVKSGDMSQSNEAYKNASRKIIASQKAQCEAGEASSCQFLANAYKFGQMDLAKNSTLAEKYEAMAQIEAQE